MSGPAWRAFPYAFVLAAMAVAPAVGSVDTGPSAARDSALFAQLTRTDWCTPGCTGAFTCHHLRFLRSGTQRRWDLSDVLERDQTAPWNFTIESDTSGFIRLGRAMIKSPAGDRTRLGGTSLLRFELRGDTLELAGSTYTRRLRPAQVVDDSTRRRGDLPILPKPPLLRALCAHDWVRLDDFDRFMIPDRWHFDSTLAFEIGFRSGACTQQGKFSIDGDLLLVGAPGHGCDARGYNIYERRLIAATVVRDTLTLDGRQHADVRFPHLTRLAGFPSRSEGIRLEIAYDGELRAGAPTPLRLRFRCESYYRDNAPYRLREFRASMQPRRPMDGGRGTDGPRVRVAERTYGDRLLALGASLADTVTIVPPAGSDEVDLLLEWDYLDGHGLLPGKAEVLVPVR